MWMNSRKIAWKLSATRRIWLNGYGLLYQVKLEKQSIFKCDFTFICIKIERLSVQSICVCRDVHFEDKWFIICCFRRGQRFENLRWSSFNVCRRGRFDRSCYRSAYGNDRIRPVNIWYIKNPRWRRTDQNVWRCVDFSSKGSQSSKKIGTCTI